MSYAQQDADNEFDEEIFDIFVEEATEVLEGLDGNLPKWQAEHANRPVLTEIRRAFHTLKGSGRMAKAMEIAEIAWKVEQALNKALDGTLEISNALIDIVFTARNEIPPLVEALKQRQPVSLSAGHLARLCERIDAVARGEAVQPAPIPATVVPVVAAAPGLTFTDLEPLRLELADLSMRLDTCSATTDEALKLARTTLTRLEQTDTALAGVASRVDLDGLQHQQQTLSNAIAELRHLLKATNDRLAQQQTDARQLLEQRLNDEWSSLMACNSRLTDDVLRMQQQVNATRRWAITMAGSFAGGAFLLSLGAFLLMR